jgi:para-nitrobenzyl esterase
MSHHLRGGLVGRSAVLGIALGSISVLGAAYLAPAAAAADPLEVAIESGVVSGIDTGVTREWRGIPYASPPVGHLRWTGPSPVEPWLGVRDASEFRPDCIQLISEIDTVGTEDCLYLNVFAPAGEATAADLPVMVHLHGGSNSGFGPYRNASAFVDDGVIVVTVAYRLGVFGFVGHPDLSMEQGGASGEYGLFDQIAALEWVQRNIAAFGGDPGNVTLFGESAGSFDATALVASPRGRGLFERAALQTEAFFPFYEPGPIAVAEELGVGVADSVGCSSAADVVGCLRGRPADQLVVALGPLDVAPWMGGEILPRSPRDLIAAQDDTVPLLVGSNREEATFFFEEAFTGAKYSRGDYVLDTGRLVAPDAARAVQSLFPVGAYDGALWAAVAAYTDGVYACPIRALALTSSGPVWRYLYSHVYDNDEFLASLRASHFLDDPIMWHDAALLEGFGAGDYEFSAAEAQLSAAMTGYWTNFAKTGDPNGAGLPEWTPFTAATRHVLEFDNSIELLDGWHDKECDFFDSAPLFIKPGWYSSGNIPSEIPLPGPGDASVPG